MTHYNEYAPVPVQVEQKRVPTTTDKTSQHSGDETTCWTFGVMATMRSFIALFLVFIILSVSHGKRSYDGYQVLRVTTSSPEQVKLISVLEENAEIDVWSNGRNHFDIMVSPEKLVHIQDILTQSKATYVVLHENVQKDIDEEQARLARNRNASSPFLIDYDDYNTYSDIIEELDELALRCPVRIECETFVIGQTYEGRNIKGLHISRRDRKQNTIYIDANIHAREWISSATHLKITKHLIDDYEADTQVQDLVNTYEWYLIPIINPDGYQFTWSNDRLWRKNRSPNGESECVGTDLNRNFDQLWGNAGTSDSPCSETYGGSGPASELEVQAVQAALNTIFGRDLITSIHLHSYGQIWLIPWGNLNDLGECDIAADHAEMMTGAHAAADATQNTHGTTWTRGNWCESLYPSSGTAQDYAKATSGVKYTFTPELRGNSFIIDADQIHPSFQEIWNGVTAAIAAIDP